jgi:hypothetical protein
MKIKPSILFSLLTFFVIAIAVIEVNNFSIVPYETAIESVSEYENSESESITDTADVITNAMVLSTYYKSVSFCAEGFIFFNLTKEIFRPPWFV